MVIVNRGDRFGRWGETLSSRLIVFVFHEDLTTAIAKSKVHPARKPCYISPRAVEDHIGIKAPYRLSS